MLCNEPIAIYDIKISGCLYRLKYGFESEKISLLIDMLKIMQEYPEAFESGCILYFMWKHSLTNEFKDSIKVLKSEGYILISKEDIERGIYNVYLTEKFYEALKKSFYYDFDLKVVKPTLSCIYSCS